MYTDTVTLFNRHDSSSGTIWYPTVITGVNLNMDKASIMAKHGAESKDNAVLNIRYQIAGNGKIVDGKQYFPPKEWKRQSTERLPATVTFTSGTNFDFFMLGDYGSKEPISDDDYTDGFYNEMNRLHDYVFAITSVAEYSVIPHFEIMGA